MIKKAIVALDGSRHSLAAAEYTFYIAEKIIMRVVGIHVVDVVALEGSFLHDLAGSLGFEPFQNFSVEMKSVLEENGHAILSDFKGRSVKARIEVDTKLLSGIVANEIAKEAKLADLVIVGRRGINAKFEHGMLGSVTEGLIRKSPSAVFIVPSEFREIKNPLLAYDGGEHSIKLLQSAVELLKPLRLPLTIISVADDKEASERLLKEAEDYLRDHNKGKDMKVNFVVATGLPDEAILDCYTEKAHDLLFLGATHHSKVYEMVLGSTTEHIMRVIDGPIYLQR
jgi:nucleotide-binding universal stress UspA family protein